MTVRKCFSRFVSALGHNGSLGMEVAYMGEAEQRMRDSDFERIYREYREPIRRYLVGMTRDDHLAQDLTQETFEKALGSLASFRGESSVQTWLYRIATNSAHDAFRGGC
jgi:DNA-directed RNA polymerase specialized sigma24 family protein